jgi:hypothetical protein
VPFTCTEIVGYSVTEQWYNGGFTAAVPDPTRWQLRWYNGASIDLWAQGSAFAGWTDTYLTTRCALGWNAPDRIVLNVSGDYHADAAWWVSQVQRTINFIRTTYSPNVRQIVLQPPVGGPAGSMCSTTDPLAPLPWVRASYNWSIVEAAIRQLLSPSVVQGAYTEVTGCGDYLDWVGHLATGAPRQAVGSSVANFYSQTR